MVKVRKSDIWRTTRGVTQEAYEEFDRKKIEMALVRAGARGPDVEEIAATVKPFEGMTTADVEKAVLKELEKRDPITAKFWKIKVDYQKGRFKKGGL